MYTPDLGAAIALPRSNLLSKIAAARALRSAAPVVSRPIIGMPFRPMVTPVLKMPLVTGGPMVVPAAQPQYAPAPVTAPITPQDAAPSAGGPNYGPSIVPNVPASFEEASQASLFDSSKMPLLLALAAGAFLLSRRK